MHELDDMINYLKIIIIIMIIIMIINNNIKNSFSKLIK